MVSRWSRVKAGCAFALACVLPCAFTPGAFAADDGRWPVVNDTVASAWKQGIDGSGVKVAVLDTQAVEDYPALKDADITCVIAVKMRVRNKDNVEGGIKAYVWHLVPESAPNYDFVVNTDLITQAMPVLGGSAAFAVQVGAENELLVPFMMQNTNDYFEGYETVRFEKAFPGTYTMKMTDLPERRLFRFEVK